MSITPCQYCENSILMCANEEFPSEWSCIKTTPKADACQRSGYGDFEVSEHLREVMAAFPNQFRGEE